MAKKVVLCGCSGGFGPETSVNHRPVGRAKSSNFEDPEKWQKEAIL